MQSATADVNQAVVSTRLMFQNAYRSRNMTDVRTAISILNQILPEKLKLIFDSHLYREDTKERHSVKCTSCDNSVELIDSNFVYDLNSPGMGKWEKVHANQVILKILKCGKCFKEIDLEHSDIMETITNEYSNHSLYVPAEPKIYNVFDNALNEANFWDWARLVAGKLENQFREFRADFAVENKNNEDMI